MTAFFKGKAIGQTDKILIDESEYQEKELKEILKKHKKELLNKQPKKVTR